MRRMLLLVTTISLELVLVVGGVAASQQLQQQSTSSQSTTTPEKSSGDVSIQSTTVKASFASGSGANFLGVKVSNHGNLTSFESPQGKENLFSGAEGYAVCSNFNNTVHGHDTGAVEAGFGTPTFVQPTAGTFPLTVTRNTTDGKFQLKQVWNNPDAIEKDVTVTMTLKNLSSATIESVVMSRTGDFDVGASSNDLAAATEDSVWQWDDRFGVDRPAGGVMLTALTFGTTHGPRVETANTWSTTRAQCPTNEVGTPTPSVQDLTMRVFYFLGNLSAGQSKTVKYKYSRM